MEAHAAFTNAAVRGIRARSARPGLQRIDAIAKPKPGLAGTQACCDAGADRSGHQICEQRIIGRHRVIATFEAPFLDEGRFPLSEKDSETIASWAPTDPSFNRYTSSGAGGSEEPVASRCDWHYISSAINWDGTVAPCCTVFDNKDDFGKLDYGNDSGYMATINGDKYRGIRNLFAGRSRKPLGLICERCPTPSIMRYGRYVNKRIAVMLSMQCLLAARRVLRLGAAP